MSSGLGIYIITGALMIVFMLFSVAANIRECSRDLKRIADTLEGKKHDH